MQLLSLYVGKKAGELGGLEIAGFCLTPTLSTGLEKLLKPGISESRNSPISSGFFLFFSSLLTYFTTKMERDLQLPL